MRRGDCGACTVAIVERDAAGKPTYRGVNSCIALLPMFAGREVVTVEGLAGKGGELHAVQSAMVDNYGSQCGYCTPGFVMSLFEGYYRGDCTKACDMSDQLCGNLCRCTGYRPIRDAALDALAHSKASKDSPPGADLFRDRLRSPVPIPSALSHEAGDARFVRPTTLDGLFEALQGHPKATLIAGATEIGVDVTKKFASFPFLVATDAVPELTGIRKTDEAWFIGGSVPLTAIEEALAREYPSLGKMLKVFAARQIRNRATLGGNLATASPIGDGAPLLLSLDAELVLASSGGRRRVPLADFFTAYRKTVLGPGEIILEIVLPRRVPAGLTRRSDFPSQSVGSSTSASWRPRSRSTRTQPVLSATLALPMAGSLRLPCGPAKPRRPSWDVRSGTRPPSLPQSSRGNSSRSTTPGEGPPTGAV